MKNVRITVLLVCFAVLTACSGWGGDKDEYYRPNLPDHPVTKVEASSGGSATTESSDAGSDAGASSTGGASSIEEGGSSGTMEAATGGTVQVILL